MCPTPPPPPTFARTSSLGNMPMGLMYNALQLQSQHQIIPHESFQEEHKEETPHPLIRANSEPINIYEIRHEVSAPSETMITTTAASGPSCFDHILMKMNQVESVSYDGHPETTGFFVQSQMDEFVAEISPVMPLVIPPMEMAKDEETKQEIQQDFDTANVEEATAGNSTQPVSRCDQCGLTFRSFSGLYHHQKTHEGQLYKCPEVGCEKEYKTEHLLRRHLKVHRDHRDGNLKCPHCEKTFCRADYLEIHIKRHLGQKDEKCPECGKGFVCKSDLIRHKLNVHSAYGRYQCPDCGKRLRSNTSLNRHRQSRLCIKQLFPGTYPDAESDIQYTYEETAHEIQSEYVSNDLSPKTALHENSAPSGGGGGSGASPRVPVAVTVSVASPNPPPTQIYHQPTHDQHPQQSSSYQQSNQETIIENATCSPLIKQQNPILNQTLDHLPGHDETTDLNLIEENHREKFNDVLLSNQTLHSPTSTSTHHHHQHNHYHQSVIQETGSLLNLGQSGNHPVSGQLQASLMQPFNIGSHFGSHQTSSFNDSSYMPQSTDFLSLPSHPNSQDNQFTHTLLQSI